MDTPPRWSFLSLALALLLCPRCIGGRNALFVKSAVF